MGIRIRNTANIKMSYYLSECCNVVNGMYLVYRNLSQLNCFFLQVVEQLNKRFQPSPIIIKKRIEGLIEREYMKRSDHDRKMYIYLAQVITIEPVIFSCFHYKSKVLSTSTWNNEVTFPGCFSVSSFSALLDLLFFINFSICHKKINKYRYLLF